VKPPKRKAQLWLAGLLALSAFTPSCNRSVEAGASASVSGSVKKLPFHTNVAGPADAAATFGKNGLPFPSQHMRILPAGTLLTVRLQQALDSSNIRPGDGFAAVVAEPVSVDGDPVVSSGMPVIGVIESALVSKQQSNPGYLRLALSAISIDGKRFPLQTSSLFAQGLSTSTRAGDKALPTSVRLTEGRRLTFRLTVPAALGDRTSTPVAYGENSVPKID